MFQVRSVKVERIAKILNGLRFCRKRNKKMLNERKYGQKYAALLDVHQKVKELFFFGGFRFMFSLPERAMATVLTPPSSRSRCLALDPKSFSR